MIEAPWKGRQAHDGKLLIVSTLLGPGIVLVAFWLSILRGAKMREFPSELFTPAYAFGLLPTLVSCGLYCIAARRIDRLKLRLSFATLIGAVMTALPLLVFFWGACTYTATRSPGRSCLRT